MKFHFQEDDGNCKMLNIDHESTYTLLQIMQIKALMKKTRFQKVVGLHSESNL